MALSKQFISSLETIASNQESLNLIHAKINLGSEQEIMSVDQLQACYVHILASPDLVAKLDKLEPNQSIRFGKSSTQPNPLPRTCVIQKFPDGHLELILMPNRKFADGSKSPARVQNGSQKKMKIAFRIDNVAESDIRRARLQVELDTNAPGQDAMSLDRIRNEGAVSQQLSTSKYVSPIFIGSPYKHQKNSKQTSAIYAFAKLGLGDLIDIKAVLNTQELSDYNIPNNMPFFLKSVIDSLLIGLSDLEAAKIVHVDLDFRNILLNRDENGKLITQYIDFDNAIDLKKGPSTRFGGTHLVMSPDVFDSTLEHMAEKMGAQGPKNATYVYNRRESFGWHTYVAMKNKGYKFPVVTRSDFKDCIWSVGVIIFYLLTQRLPTLDEYTRTTIQQNPLLAGMLALTRDKRFSAEQALACWQANPTLFFETRPAEQYSMRAKLDAEAAEGEKILQEIGQQNARHKLLQEKMLALKSELDGLVHGLQKVGLGGQASAAAPSSSTPQFAASKAKPETKPAIAEDKNLFPGLKRGFFS